MPKPGSAQKFLVNRHPESEVGVRDEGGRQWTNNLKRKKGRIPLENCKESRKKDKNPSKQDPVP